MIKETQQSKVSVSRHQVEGTKNTRYSKTRKWSLSSSNILWLEPVERIWRSPIVDETEEISWFTWNQWNLACHKRDYFVQILKRNL